MQLSYVCPEKAVFPGQTSDIVRLVGEKAVLADERVVLTLPNECFCLTFWICKAISVFLWLSTLTLKTIWRHCISKDSVPLRIPRL